MVKWEHGVYRLKESRERDSRRYAGRSYGSRNWGKSLLRPGWNTTRIKLRCFSCRPMLRNIIRMNT